MNNGQREILVDQIPQSILDAMTDSYASYTVGILGVEAKTPYQETELIGTGTLVYSNGVVGILTADHVLQYLLGTETDTHPGYTKMGLIYTKTQGAVAYPLLNYVSHHVEMGARTIARDRSKELGYGPDLAYIPLHPKTARLLQAENDRQFFNLDMGRTLYRARQPLYNEGIWAIFGYLAEETGYELIEGTEGEYQPFTKAYAFFGGPKDGLYVEGEYDYLDLHPQYRSSTKLPFSFNKASGGGVWFSPVYQLNDGTYDIATMQEQTLLAGVIFGAYRYLVSGQTKVVRCHGWAGMYNQIYNAING